MSKILSTGEGDMTFHEKSALTMTVLLALIFGWYFALVFGVVAGSPEREIAYTALMIVAVAALAIVATVSHVILALVFRSDANSYDERDRSIVLRSERIAGHVLAAGVFAGITLAMVRVDRFWIAQALIAALVLAEVTDGIVKLVLYRRAT